MRQAVLQSRLLVGANKNKMNLTLNIYKSLRTKTNISIKSCRYALSYFNQSFHFTRVNFRLDVEYSLLELLKMEYSFQKLIRL